MACTCFSVSDDEEEGVVSHDLWVQHQRPRQCNHTCRRANNQCDMQCKKTIMSMYFFIYMIFETRLIFINNNTNNNIEYINR